MDSTGDCVIGFHEYISTLITNSVRIAHSADLDTPANNKYSTPASRLYSTHKVQCGHHIPDPLIGLSPEAFALNAEFDKSSKSHTTHLFRPVVHKFDSNRESGFIVRKHSRRYFHDIAQTKVPTSVASRSETLWSVGSGVNGTSSSSELLSLYLLQTHSIPQALCHSHNTSKLLRNRILVQNANMKCQSQCGHLRCQPHFRIQK